ncbi:MAG: hypothetical protein ACK41C_18870 [Phenylobacterium sp.]|uniref:hypothetical protein n=1 Tax=Phenylobacterium sp. TaxID=1871053 RepID=UPI00391C1458
MSALLIALALLAQDAPAAEAVQDAPAAVDETPFPTGAPRDDYGLVSWCYGALAGYLDLKPQVMPEVRRIEAAFRAPGRTLAQDLKIYDDIEKEGRANLKLFARAIEAAEKASPRPIAPIGAEALRKGRNTWSAAPNLPKARLAQEWMSWTLPARCAPTAESLETRAKLLGVAFDPLAESPDSATPES